MHACIRRITCIRCIVSVYTHTLRRMYMYRTCAFTTCVQHRTWHGSCASFALTRHTTWQSVALLLSASSSKSGLTARACSGTSACQEACTGDVEWGTRASVPTSASVPFRRRPRCGQGQLSDDITAVVVRLDRHYIYIYIYIHTYIYIYTHTCVYIYTYYDIYLIVVVVVVVVVVVLYVLIVGLYIYRERERDLYIIVQHDRQTRV